MLREKTWLVLMLMVVMVSSTFVFAGNSGPVKIGLLEDRSGNFALVGLPKYHATLLAVKEINDSGGILGRKVEVIAPDPQSDNSKFQQLTRKLIMQDKVDVLMAGFASAEREAIRPIVDRYKQLYFYNNQYEGGVADKYTFCTGAVPEQQISTIIPYMVENYGPRMYILAADYNFGQISAKWVHKVVKDTGKGEIIGEEFIPLSVSQFSSTIEKVQKANPDFLVMFITGNNHAAFYPQANAAGLKIPYASSINVAQGYEHKRFEAPALARMHVTVNYVEEIPTEANRDFVRRYRAMFPDETYIPQQAENAYNAVYIYKVAAEMAGTTNQEEVIKALESGKIAFDAPEGRVVMDPKTHHLTHTIRLIRVDEEHNVDFLYTWENIEPYWLREIGVDLTKKAEFKQYQP